MSITEYDCMTPGCERKYLTTNPDFLDFPIECEACYRITDEIEFPFRGLPKYLYLELKSHMSKTRQVEEIPESIISLYSAISRPGSWEWHSLDGSYCRYILKERGYHSIDDPEASWRVIWKKD